MNNIFKGLLFMAMLLAISERSAESSKSIQPVNYQAQEKKLTDKDYEEIDCLARNIFFEARGEEFWGRLAVAAVTLNRSNKYDVSICKVVHEKHQFSWTKQYDRDMQNKMISREFGAWDEVVDLAKNIYMSPSMTRKAGIGDRIHFYNLAEIEHPPRWIQVSYDRVQIGKHTFARV